ncbi:MAG: hypothetical protein JSV26_07525 [bacterium]|nr:MAG: hypothetical protein JSV26_07525 [bacterium]
MYSLLGEYMELPIPMEDIVKIHRGMNQVKVSVGERMSEPSEVYIVTTEEKEGGKLSTYVVFYLEKLRRRIVYGYADLPFEPDRRIQVEAEAIEFVEEMGAIVEDIAWENLSDRDRSDWLANQPLYSSPEEESDQLEYLSEDALIPDTEEEEHREEGPARPGDQEGTRGILDDSSDKVVFVEEKFDEMLQQVFLNQPQEGKREAVDRGIRKAPAEISPEEEGPGDADGPPTAGGPPDAATADGTAAGPDGPEMERRGSPEEVAPGEPSVPDESRRKVLRFLSKM